MTLFVKAVPRRPLASVALLVVAASGCYTTRPLTTPQPSIGQRVEVRLNDQGSVDLAPLIGAQMVAIEGTVTNAADGQLVLRVLRTEQRNGLGVTWAGEPVTVPRSAIASIRERSLDRRRSYLMGGGIAALAALLAVLFATGVLGGGSGEGENPPQ